MDTMPVKTTDEKKHADRGQVLAVFDHRLEVAMSKMIPGTVAIEVTIGEGGGIRGFKLSTAEHFGSGKPTKR